MKIVGALFVPPYISLRAKQLGSDELFWGILHSLVRYTDMGTIMLPTSSLAQHKELQ